MRGLGQDKVDPCKVETGFLDTGDWDLYNTTRDCKPESSSDWGLVHVKCLKVKIVLKCLEHLYYYFIYYSKLVVNSNIRTKFLLYIHLKGLCSE